jgi:hypothetical protein
MTASEWAGWIGATTGIASLGWNIYVKATSGPKLDVQAISGMKIHPPPPGNPTYLSLTVQNNGSAPTTLTNVTLQLYKSKRARRKQKAAENYVIGEYDGPRLPYKLEIGSQWQGLVRTSGHFDQLLATGDLWCGIHHSFSKRAVEVKVIEPKVIGPSKATT